MSEYAFSIRLPDSICEETMMFKFGATNNLSVTYYLKAQLEPINPSDYANLQEKTSMIRCDFALYLYEPFLSAIEESKS